jgi:hypothetical protein
MTSWQSADECSANRGDAGARDATTHSLLDEPAVRDEAALLRRQSQVCKSFCLRIEPPHPEAAAKHVYFAGAAFAGGVTVAGAAAGFAGSESNESSLLAPAPLSRAGVRPWAPDPPANAASRPAPAVEI